MRVARRTKRTLRVTRELYYVKLARHSRVTRESLAKRFKKGLKNFARCAIAQSIATTVLYSEPLHAKTRFFLYENKDAVTAQLISTPVYSTQIIQTSS